MCEIQTSTRSVKFQAIEILSGLVTLREYADTEKGEKIQAAKIKGVAKKKLYNYPTNKFRCNQRFDFCALLITMVDYNVFNFARAYLDHFYQLN